MMSISRNGINRVYTSPFRKCSFEETVDILLKAAVYSNLDKLKGVTENIMMGQLASLGTGCFNIMMDTDYLLPSDEDKEKMMNLVRLYPEQNPILEVETVVDQTMPNYIKTPLINMQTPIGKDSDTTNSQYNNIMTPNLFTPVMTPGTPLHQNTPKANQNILYSPFITQKTPIIQNKYASIQSPMLSPNFQPQGQTNQNSQFQQNQELRYSPITPSYNPVQQNQRTQRTPVSRHHMPSQSPTYSYENTPKYSGLGSPQMSSSLHGSPIDSDPQQYMKIYKPYHPETPSYQVDGKMGQRDDEEQYSEEEDDKNN